MGYEAEEFIDAGDATVVRLHQWGRGKGIPTSRRRPPLPWRTSREPRRGSRSRSERERLLDAKAAAPKDDDQGAQASAVAAGADWRITATISSTVGGSAG
jgi:hypothetical protein